MSDHQYRASFFRQAVAYLQDRGGEDAVYRTFSDPEPINEAWDLELEEFRRFSAGSSSGGAQREGGCMSGGGRQTRRRRRARRARGGILAQRRIALLLGVALVLCFVGEVAAVWAGADVLMAVFLVAILVLLGIVIKWGGAA